MSTLRDFLFFVRVILPRCHPRLTSIIRLSKGLAWGLVCSIIYSGLKGSGHNAGPTFISGFGAHHPGGIILSDEERIVLKDRNIKHEVIASY